jgi:hypothetical protein
MEDANGEMETIAETEALNHEIAEARTHIESDMKDPAAASASAAGEVGMVGEMWNALSKRGKKIAEIKWKDAKATIAAGLSILPAIGTASNIGSAVRLGKEYMKVRNLANNPTALATSVIDFGAYTAKQTTKEAVKKEFIDSLKHIPHNPIRELMDTPGILMDAWRKRGDLNKEKSHLEMTKRDQIDGITHESHVTALDAQVSNAQKAKGEAYGRAGKSALLWVGHEILRRVDPFPDVPPIVATVAGLAEFVLPGSNIVPALWQLGSNKIQESMEVYRALGDIKDIVLRRLDMKLSQHKKPDVAQAVMVFGK